MQLKEREFENASPVEPAKGPPLLFGLSASLKRTVARNTTANVIRGAASAVVAIALPHFLVRTLLPARFSAWSLLLQIAAFASFMDFGLQTAVATFLAQAVRRNDVQHQNRLISSAFAMLCVSGLMGVAITVCMAASMPVLFRQLPPYLIAEVRTALLILGVSTAVQLPLSTFGGILVGLHRNEYTALAIGGSRLMGALLVVCVSRYASSLAVFALVLAGCNLIGGLAQIPLACRLLRSFELSLRLVDMTLASQLLRYCSTLVVFSFGMLIVTGLDVSIVGHFDFAAVAAYSMAAGVITLISGLNSAFFSALLAPVAVLQVDAQFKRINQIVARTTRAAVVVNLTLSCVIFVFGRSLLTAWVGAHYAASALPILEILAVAQTIRLAGVGFCMVSIAIGEQRWGIPGAIAEASVNLCVSIVGGLWLGPIGVALGTLAGAIVGESWMILFTMKWVQSLRVSRASFVMQAIMRPVVCCLPMEIEAVLVGCFGFRVNPIAVLASVIASALLTAWVAYSRPAPARRLVSRDVLEVKTGASKPW